MDGSTQGIVETRVDDIVMRLKRHIIGMPYCRS